MTDELTIYPAWYGYRCNFTIDKKEVKGVLLGLVIEYLTSEYGGRTPSGYSWQSYFAVRVHNNKYRKTPFTTTHLLTQLSTKLNNIVEVELLFPYPK